MNMTETERKLAYHRHELNRFRLMGYADSLANVHREAIERLTKIQEQGPVLSNLQAKHVASWMCQRRSVLKELVASEAKGSVGTALISSYVEWLIASVKDCQCDMRISDWEFLLKFLKAEGAAFAMTLPVASAMTNILNNIRSAIACPA